jgi:hypothetical protein
MFDSYYDADDDLSAGHYFALAGTEWGGDRAVSPQAMRQLQHALLTQLPEHILGEAPTAQRVEVLPQARI